MSNYLRRLRTGDSGKARLWPAEARSTQGEIRCRWATASAMSLAMHTKLALVLVLVLLSACGLSHQAGDCVEGSVSECSCGSEPGVAACDEGRLGRCSCLPDPCPPGRRIPCSCEDGTSTRLCDDEGVYGECQCPATDAGRPLDAGLPGDAGTSGPDAGPQPLDGGADAGADGDAGPIPDGCVPHTCAELFASCGVLRDGCGRAINCGQCTLSTISRIPLEARDLLTDDQRGAVYVTTPGTAGVRGNSVVALDPASGAERWSVVVGSEPGPLALSDDASVLWVGLDGSDTIRILDLETRTPGVSHRVGGNDLFDSLRAGDIEVIPGEPRTVLVSTRTGPSDHFGGVFMFDDDGRRGVGTPGHTGARRLEVASATIAYGYNDSSTEFGFRDLALSSAGVTEGTVTGNLLGGFDTDIVLEGDLVFSTNGHVVDPSVPARLGRLPVVGTVAADASTNRIYVVEGVGSLRRAPYDLVALDRTTFVEIGRVALPDVQDVPRRLHRWGERGVAFLEGPRSAAGGRASHIVVVTSNVVSVSP